MPSLPPVEGSFNSGEFAGLLRSLNAAAVEGRLEVSAEQATCSLFISGGRVDAIAADEERFKLGSWLSARGVLEPGRTALALLKQPPDVPFGEFLVDEGLLQEEQLAQELQLRAAAMIGLLLFTSGTYRFKKDEAPVGGKAVSMELDTTGLLLAAARNSDMAQLEQLTSDGGRQGIRVDASVLERARESLLSPDEAFLLSRINGQIDADRLQHLVPMSKPDLLKALGALVVAGLAELSGDLDESAVPTVEAEAEKPAGKTQVPSAGSASTSATQSRQRREIQHLVAEIEGRDFYRRLGLSRGATQDQVHQRFKEMTRLYSTERAEESHLASLRGDLEKIQEALVEAYRTLTDPRQRAKYDEFLRSGGETAERGDYRARGRQNSARRELVDANLKRVQELVRMGQFGEAIQLLEQAVRLDPQPETLLTLARLELRNPMWSQRALDRLRLALSTDTQFTEGWLELASFWAKRKKKERQRECLRRILEYDPDNAEVQQALIDIGVV